MATSRSPFYIPVNLGHTALLLADIQDQIAARFTSAPLDTFTDQVLSILTLHIFPAGINTNGIISPYNKLSAWFKKLESSGVWSREASDPRRPAYAVVDKLRPQNDEWGTKDEIIVTKITAGFFSSSDLQGYLRARGIRHVVICGLTTASAILGSVRLGADLSFHVVVPREAVMDDDPEVNDFLLDRVLPRFVDVVGIEDVKALFS